MRLLGAAVLAWTCHFSATSPALAHDLGVTSAAVVLRGDGAFLVDLTADLDALLLAAGAGHRSEELAARIAALPEDERADRVERLSALFARRIRVRFDGQPVDFGVSFPDRRSADDTTDGAAPTTWLGSRVRLAGRMPAEWKHVTFWASRAFGAVRLSVLDAPSGRTVSHELEAGGESPPFERVPGG